MHIATRLVVTAALVTSIGVAHAQPSSVVPPSAVETELVSTEAEQWEVLVDRAPACVTPCRLQLDRPRWITLRSRERSPVRLEVGELGREPSRVTAKPLGKGKWVTGVTFTALGGTAAVTGIALTSVGCATDRDGMCTAGLITGGAGLAVTGLGIWLIRRGLPRFTVRALESRNLAVYGTGTGGGLAGRF